MDPNSTELKLSFTNSTKRRSAIISNRDLENERILDTITDLISTLLDDLFTSFPEIRENAIIKHYTDINRFLAIHNTEFDKTTLSVLEDGLAKNLKFYPWEAHLKKSLNSQWRSLFLHSSLNDPSNQIDYIDNMVKVNQKLLKEMLILCSQHLDITRLSSGIFPDILEFSQFFKISTERLKKKTLYIYKLIDLKKQEDSPRIQKAQIEKLTKKTQNRTEWVNFSEQLSDSLKIEVHKTSLANCCAKCCKKPIISRTLNCVFAGPVGWDITRVFLEVIEGRFNNISILETQIRENIVYIDVEVWYYQYSNRSVWFNMKVEGTSSRKKTIEIKSSEINEYLVFLDKDGAHEINENIEDSL